MLAHSQHTELLVSAQRSMKIREFIQADNDPFYSLRIIITAGHQPRNNTIQMMHRCYIEDILNIFCGGKTRSQLKEIRLCLTYLFHKYSIFVLLMRRRPRVAEGIITVTKEEVRS